ncbi:HI0933-like protein [Fragilariopsis cylindrus CCMP1102]|uniref:HI0933-like protein n=1 Tax=Fragilariopsis cylindrus CCMP1102 TaxID=635003 RepID=A0A1E7FAZ7_9STRA|nr:HI0933-like protein [Fragilariopsis cylindrus CCMP1102]|eukprot:OEU15314.1 HI0933-like protein [Fragilariopsis cylindrus CCMP1102]
MISRTVIRRERQVQRRRPWRLAGIFAVTAVSFTTKRNFLATITTGLSSSSSSPSSRHDAQFAPNNSNKIAVVGGGASGIFAAIAAAENNAGVATEVVVIEATSSTLSKVKISGGGRCNVLHDTSKSVPTILAGYPRGQRELNGLYHKRFTPTMARDWFEQRGVILKVEEDGRMFPVTDSSQTIIDTLMKAAENVGVEIRYRNKVVSIDKKNNDDSDDEPVADGSNNLFTVNYKDGTQEDFCSIILATGSAPAGHLLAKSLGHDPLVQPVPSLFTLNCKHAVSSSDDENENGLLHGLSGVSKQQLVQEGPLLITHHGISGPATLRLSAFAAREFRDINYRGHVTINWDAGSLPNSNPDQVLEELWKVTQTNPKRGVASVCPLPNNSIPRRLWQALVFSSGFTSDSKWGSVSKKSVRLLAQNIVECRLEITSKGTFKEEFVTAGGVDLKEINMKTMESKICPGLFLCGEVINVDGVTGGYNFMNCWSTGFVAGESSSSYQTSLLVKENEVQQQS